MNAKVSVVYDEGALPGTALIGARGSAYCIEIDGERTLFGFGLRGRYLRHNLEALGMDPDSFDRAVVADSDSEEWGAAGEFLKARSSAFTVSAPASVWGSKKIFGCTGMYFPADVAEKAVRADLNPGWNELSEHLFAGVFGNNAFQEAVLVIRAAQGPVVISNRCLSGMKSIFDAVTDRFKKSPVAYIGGLDIGKKNDALCDATAAFLRDSGCRDIRINHCAKPIGINRMRVTLGLDGVKDFFVGESAEFPL